MEFLAAILPALFAAIGGITTSFIGNSINKKAQEEVNAKNLAYSQAMTEKAWQRDDTSLERQVKDAEEAGLSPLAVTGAMNSSSPLNYSAQAPQMDLSSLVGAFSSFDNMTTPILEKQKEKKEDERLDKQLTYQVFQLEKQIQSDKDLQQNEFLQKSTELGKQLTYQYNVLSEESRQWKAEKDYERLQSLQSTSLETYKEIASSLGKAPRTQETSNIEQYHKLYDNFMSAYTAYLKDASDYCKSLVSSTSDSASLGSNAAGIAGVNFSEGSQVSMNETSQNEQQFHLMYDKYIGVVAFPIFVPDNNFESKTYKYE